MSFRQKYTITLEFFAPTADTFKTIEQVALSSAQELYATAVLISGGSRVPIVEIEISHGTRASRTINKDGKEVD